MDAARAGGGEEVGEKGQGVGVARGSLFAEGATGGEEGGVKARAGSLELWDLGG